MRFLKKKDGCMLCPLNKEVMVPPDGDLAKAKLIVVGQNPGMNEVLQGKPFVGASGKLLWPALEEATGLKRTDCYITNSMKCTPSKGNNPPKAWECCGNQFDTEWKSLYGKRLLLLGEWACERVVGSKVRPETYTFANGSPILSLHHPAWALHSGESDSFKEGFRLVKPLLRTKSTRVRPIFSVVDRLSQLEGFVQTYLLKKRPVAFDLETTGLDSWSPTARIMCIGFSDGVNTHVVDWASLGESQDAVEAVRAILSNGDIPKIAMNCKFDMLWMKKLYGVDINNLYLDPSVEQFLLGDYGGSLSLKQLIFMYYPEYVGYDFGMSYDELILPENRDKLFEYNAVHSFLTNKVALYLEPFIVKLGCKQLIHDILMPAEVALMEMTFNGLRVDLKRLKEESRRNVTKTKALETKIKAQAEKVGMGEDFNLNSPYFLRKFFFKGLKLKPIGKTNTGLPSLNAENLDRMAKRGVKVASDILEFRGLKKIQGTYYDNYLEMATPAHPYIHSQYNTTWVATGRLSSSNPNVQNVPSEVRSVFVSRFPKGKLVQADFKQIEMRVMALESRDKAMTKIFKENKDPHAMVASAIWGYSEKEIVEKHRDLRGRAKAVNFLMLYGGGYPALAHREGLEMAEAEKIVTKFFESYPDIERWQREQKRKVLHGKPIRSLTGRRWIFPKVPLVEEVGNACLNYPIQSLASDICQYTFGVLGEHLRTQKYNSLLVTTTHDSILVDCVPEEVESVKDVLQQIVDSLPEIFDWLVGVKMEIDVKVGDTWGSV